MAGSFLPPVVVTLLAETKQYSENMLKATAQMNGFAAEAEASGGRVGSAFKGLATAGAGLAAGLVAVGAMSVKLASDFQSSMEKLHTQAGVPQAAIKGLSNDVLDLAGKVGTSPDSLAEALFHVESTFQSTGKTGKQMMDILRVGAEGARIGGSNLVDTQNALDAALVSGIRGAENLQSAMGLLNATVGIGDMTMQNLAEALSSGVMPVVKNYGLSLSDVGAALATFGDNNIRGAQAGTALRMSVQALAVPVKGGEAALKAMGMTMSTMAKDMQQGGLLQALEDLKSHMDAAGITGDKVGEELTTIFGKRAGTGVAVLINGLDLLKSKYPELTAASGGFADAWKATTETYKQNMADLHATVQAFEIRLGNFLIPRVLEMGRAFMQATEWLRQHTEVAKLLAVAVGTVLVSALAAATVALGAAIAPVVPYVAAIAALGAAVYYAYTHFQGFRDVVSSVTSFLTGTAWPAIKQFSDNVRNAFTEGGFGGVLTYLQTDTPKWGHALWQWIEDAIPPVLTQLGKWASAAITWLLDTGLPWLFDTMLRWGVAIVKWIDDHIPAALDGLTRLKDALFGYLDDHLPDWIHKGGDLVIHMAQGMIEHTPQIIEALAGISLKANVWFITEFLPSVIESLAIVVDSLAGEAARLFVRIGEAIVKGILAGIGNLAGAVERKVKSLVGAAVDTVKGFLGISSPSKVFIEIGQNVGLGLIAGLQAQGDAVSMAALRMMSGIPGTANVSIAGSLSGIPGSLLIPVVGRPADMSSLAGAVGGSHSVGTNGGNLTINVNVTSGGTNGSQIGADVAVAVRDELLRYQRNNNGTGLMT